MALRRDGGSIIEAVITKGDLAKLTPVERTQYYNEVCRSVGLNPFTRPFEFITLNGKLVLYARRECTDQLRRLNGISLEVVSREVSGDILTVHVRARDKTGRTDEDFGSVSIKGLAGEALANAQMKGLTKGKRRVTLSISGLGFLDESEVEGIPAHERAAPQDTRAALDQFAGVVPMSIFSTTNPVEKIDMDTGEVFDGDEIHAAAREAALRGTQILRDHLRSLSPEARELLREAVGTAEEPGPLLRAARLADADSIRERLRMAAPESPEITPAPPAPAVDPALGEGDFARGIPPTAASSSPPARRAAAEPQGQGNLARAGHSIRSEQDTDLEPPPRSAIWGEASFGVPLTDRHNGPDWEKWAADLVFLAEEATAAELAKLKADNKDTLQRLKVSDAVRYRSLMHDLDSGRHSAESGESG